MFHLAVRIPLPYVPTQYDHILSTIRNFTDYLDAQSGCIELNFSVPHPEDPLYVRYMTLDDIETDPYENHFITLKDYVQLYTLRQIDPQLARTYALAILDKEEPT